MPRPLSRATVVRVLTPCLSVSSTAHSSHIRIRCSTRRSTMRRASEGIGCPISRPSLRPALILNQGPFPPPALPGFDGTTSLSVTAQRPDLPSRASGWSSPTTPRGFPCCVCRPCVHAVATTPAQRRAVLPCSIRSVVSAFPERVVGSACASSFSRLAQRSRTLRPAHSRCHHIS